MAYIVYILYSPSTDEFYRGHTGDIKQRLKRHNSGYELSTKHGKPWIILWFVEEANRGEAQILEGKLKNLSRNRLIRFMEKQLENIGGPDALTLLGQWSGC